MRFKKLLILSAVMLAVGAYAVTLPRVNIRSFKGGQTRVLNNVINVTEDNITTNATAVAANLATIGTNTAQIATDGTNIATNASDIDTLESGGTVTNLTVVTDLTLTGTQTTSDSTVGAVVAATGTVVEYGNLAYHKTVITVTNASVSLADGDDGEGVKIYDFDEGVVAVHGVFCDLVATNEGNFNASPDDLYYVAIGTVEATDADNDLTTTEANLIAKQTLDTAAGVTISHDVHTFLDTPDSIDGSSTALDIWLNASVEATDNSGANTIGFTGTVTILWSPLGDY